VEDSRISICSGYATVLPRTFKACLGVAPHRAVFAHTRSNITWLAGRCKNGSCGQSDSPTSLHYQLLNLLMSKIKRALAVLKSSLKSDDDTDFPFDGFTDHRVSTKYIDSLTDDELREVNRLLPWSCFTADSSGRRFGRRAWAGKREVPQAIPDPRIVQLNEKFGLSDKHVLEVGCFEGVHTIGLAMFARHVTAVDSRIENVVKTMVRCGFFGYSTQVFKCDLEKSEDIGRPPFSRRVTSCGRPLPSG